MIRVLASYAEVMRRSGMWGVLEVRRHGPLVGYSLHMRVAREKPLLVSLKLCLILIVQQVYKEANCCNNNKNKLLDFTVDL